MHNDSGRAFFLATGILASWLLAGCDGGGGLFGWEDASDAVAGDTAVASDVASPEDQAGTTELGGGVDVGGVDSGGTAPDGATNEAPSGGVVVWQAESDYLDRAGVTAGFRWGQEPAAAGDTFGDCLVVAFDPAASTPASSLDAGTITIEGTSPGVTLTYGDVLPGGGKRYTSSLPEEQESLHPAAGTTITATAAGGAELPAFTLSAPTPTPVAIAAPSSGIFASISRDEALPVAWNAAEAESVLVAVSVLDSSFEPMAGDNVICTIEGADPGHLTIPAGAMARLPTEGGARALVSVTRVRSATVPVSGGELSLGVTASSGVAPSLY